MTEPLEHRAGPASLTWHPDRRLAVLRFVESAGGRGEHAAELVASLDRWSAHEHHYHLLVDCSRIAEVDAGWRTTWAEFFKRQTQTATVAWFNASPWMKVIIRMFRTGTGVDGRVFSTEEEARAWLDSRVTANA